MHNYVLKISVFFLAYFLKKLPKKFVSTKKLCVGGIHYMILKTLAYTSTSVNFTETWPVTMDNYTNTVNIERHVRRARFGIPQTPCIVNPWSLGCSFAHCTVLDYFLHEMPEKRPHAVIISLWNDITTYVFHHHYTITLINTDYFLKN